MALSPRFHPTPWQHARLTRIEPRTARISSYFFQLPAPFDYLPGQHVDVRLTAEDGYTAERSYSIASAPGDHPDELELAVEWLADGEVSGYFHQVAEVGDEVELRGPIGGGFIWTPQEQLSALLIAGGSGVVPMVSMARAQRALPGTPLALLLAARSWTEAPFRDELLAQAEHDPAFVLRLALSRDSTRRPQDFARRIDAPMVASVLQDWSSQPQRVYVCGSNGFVNAASDACVAAGIAASQIHTERYGG